DAGDGAGPDGPAHRAPARRAVDGAVPDPGRDDLPDHPGHQPPGHHHPAGRAERPDGPPGGEPRLRDPDGPDRAPGHRREPAEVGSGPEDVPRREVGGMAAGPVHYEGFGVGDRYETLGRTVSDYEILSFVTLTGFTEPLFMDLEYIQRESVFKTRV